MITQIGHTTQLHLNSVIKTQLKIQQPQWNYSLISI